MLEIFFVFMFVNLNIKDNAIMLFFCERILCQLNVHLTSSFFKTKKRSFHSNKIPIT